MPITTSIGSGLPTRNARSSKIHGMYSTDAAIASPSTQSTSGTPPGASHECLRATSSIDLRAGKTRKTRPSTNARCMPRCVVSRKQAEAGRVVVEARQHDRAACRRRGSPAARAAGTASRDRISPRARSLSWRRFPARGNLPRSCASDAPATPQSKRGRLAGPARRDRVARRLVRLTSACPFPCRTSRRPDGTGCRRRRSRARP